MQTRVLATTHNYLINNSIVIEMKSDIEEGKEARFQMYLVEKVSERC